MNTSFYYYLGAALSTATVLTASLYEYHKCMQIYTEMPDATLRDIMSEHKTIDSLLFGLGIIGHKIARVRSEANSKAEQHALLGNHTFLFTLSRDEDE